MIVSIKSDDNKEGEHVSGREGGGGKEFLLPKFARIYGEAFMCFAIAVSSDIAHPYIIPVFDINIMSSHNLNIILSLSLSSHRIKEISITHSRP